MIKKKWIGGLAALLMAVAVFFVSIGYFMPSIFEAYTGSAVPAYVSAMDKTAVLDIQVIADEEDWADMLENATAEEYIPATVIIDGVKMENVGIRPKGNSSLSMVAQDDTTDRYSFKIEFDHFISGQTWLGLDKIVVNNMQGDASYMKEYLSYDMMNYAGVDTPLYAFSNISVNGEAWGFYLAVEALEDSYATRLYGKDHGKLYKPENMNMGGGGQRQNREDRPERPEGMPARSERPEGAAMPEGFPAQGERPEGISAPERMPGNGDVPGEMGRGMGFGGQSNGATLQYTGDEITSYSAIFDNAVFDSTDNDYRRVIQALKKINEGEDLEKVVDVEATLKYFAAHTVIVNLDSYVSNMAHNYYLYEKDGQLAMLPWDFNLAFGGFQSGDASAIVNFPIDTPVSGVDLSDRPILAKLLEVPEHKALYHSYLQEIVDGYFNSGLFSETIDSLNALIAPYIKADPSAFYDYTSYQKAVTELKKLGLLRAESIQGQLDGTIPSTTEGQRTNPNALVDASAIDLSALGSMGGGRERNQEQNPMSFRN